MSRKIDTRPPADHPQNTVTPLEVRRGLAAAPDGLESATPAPGGDYVQRALDYLQGRPGTAGRESPGAAPAPKYVPDPHVQVTTSGAHVVHAQPNGTYILSLPPGGPVRRLTLALEFGQTDQDALYVRVGVPAADDQAPGPNHG